MSEALISFLERLRQRAESAKQYEAESSLTPARYAVQRLVEKLPDCEYKDILQYYALLEMDTDRAFHIMGIHVGYPEEEEYSNLLEKFRDEIVDGLRRYCGAK